MTADRSHAERRRDRRARLHGRAYLGVAAGLAFAHDAIVRLPAGELVHAGEQITLGCTLVLGMLGGLLLVRGERLFDDARARGRVSLWRSEGGTIPPPLARGEDLVESLALLDGGAFDTRAGVALIHARRAVEAARRRHSEKAS